MEQHRFSRMELLVGSEGMKSLRGASVAVFGIGGVGSFAAEALVRAGVGRLTLVDFDDVSLTNINRQIHALEQTVGRPKVLVMAERCRQINPAAEVEAIQDFFGEQNEAELLDRGYDYVLDCIDHVTAKLHLLESCVRRGLPVLSSMGAANKLDPSCIRAGDLFQTQKCRLARVIRKQLRRRGISSGIRVVYSTEEFRPLSGQRSADESEEGGYQERRAPLGSSSYIPPIFGLTMAGEVVRALVGEGG